MFPARQHLPKQSAFGNVSGSISHDTMCCSSSSACSTNEVPYPEAIERVQFLAGRPFAFMDEGRTLALLCKTQQFLHEDLSLTKYALGLNELKRQDLARRLSRLQLKVKKYYLTLHCVLRKKQLLKEKPDFVALLAGPFPGQIRSACSVDLHWKGSHGLDSSSGRRERSSSCQECDLANRTRP
jgi:hypothetical protein